jgi:hypothetical protein
MEKIKGMIDTKIILNVVIGVFVAMIIGWVLSALSFGFGWHSYGMYGRGAGMMRGGGMMQDYDRPY